MNKKHLLTTTVLFGVPFLLSSTAYAEETTDNTPTTSEESNAVPGDSLPTAESNSMDISDSANIITPSEITTENSSEPSNEDTLQLFQETARALLEKLSNGTWTYKSIDHAREVFDKHWYSNYDSNTDKQVLLDAITEIREASNNLVEDKGRIAFDPAMSTAHDKIDERAWEKEGFENLVTLYEKYTPLRLEQDVAFDTKISAANELNDAINNLVRNPLADSVVDISIDKTNPLPEDREVEVTVTLKEGISFSHARLQYSGVFYTFRQGWLEIKVNDTYTYINNQLKFKVPIVELGNSTWKLQLLLTDSLDGKIDSPTDLSPNNNYYVVAKHKDISFTTNKELVELESTSLNKHVASPGDQLFYTVTLKPYSYIDKFGVFNIYRENESTPFKSVSARPLHSNKRYDTNQVLVTDVFIDDTFPEGVYEIRDARNMLIEQIGLDDEIKLKGTLLNFLPNHVQRFTVTHKKAEDSGTTTPTPDNKPTEPAQPNKPDGAGNSTGGATDNTTGGTTGNTTGSTESKGSTSETSAKENTSSTATVTTNSSDKQLPSTGEADTFTIFGPAALMILTGLGLVAKKKEQ